MALTDRFLDAVRWDPNSRNLHPDEGTGAAHLLKVRVNARGGRTFEYGSVRFPGSPSPTKSPIGDYPAMSLAEARVKARAWREKIKAGVDPRKEEAAAKAATVVRNHLLFENVADDFRRLVLVGPDEKSPKQRTGVATAREIDTNFTSRFRGRSIEMITREDIETVIVDLVDRGTPAHAHNMLGHVRKLFNWAMGRTRYGLDRSPCDRMRPKILIGKKVFRDRVLNDAEIRAFWRATGAMTYPFGPLLRLLLLTGQRRSEIGEARRREIDEAGRSLNIPAARMKAKAAHVVPLAPNALAIVTCLPRFPGGDFMFSTTGGKAPVSGWSKTKTKLDEAMLAALREDASVRAESADSIELPHWTIHDLRRTMRTRLSMLPIPDLVRELTIAHTKPELHKVYDLHRYDEEKREALTLWEKRLCAIVEPPPANVIALRATA